MIAKLPINNEAGNIDDWNYNRGWNDAIDEMEKTMEPVYPDDKLVDEVVSYVIDVRSQSIEQSLRGRLIALGWTTPEATKTLKKIDEGKNALLEDLANDNEYLEHQVNSLRDLIYDLEEQIDRYDDVVEQNNRQLTRLYKDISRLKRLAGEAI